MTETIETRLEQLERLSGIDRAGDEAVRAQRAAAELTTQQQITALLTEIQDATAAAASAKRDAESNVRKAVTAQKLHLLHEATKRKARARLNAITGDKHPIESETSLCREQSMLWASQLKTISGYRFGILEMP